MENKKDIKWLLSQILVSKILMGKFPKLEHIIHTFYIYKEWTWFILYLVALNSLTRHHQSFDRDRQGVCKYLRFPIVKNRFINQTSNYIFRHSSYFLSLCTMRNSFSFFCHTHKRLVLYVLESVWREKKYTHIVEHRPFFSLEV